MERRGVRGLGERVKRGEREGGGGGRGGEGGYTDLSEILVVAELKDGAAVGPTLGERPDVFAVLTARLPRLHPLRIKGAHALYGRELARPRLFDRTPGFKT